MYDAADKQTWAYECALADVGNLFSAQKHGKLAAFRNPLSLRCHWAAGAFKRWIGIITIMSILHLKWRGREEQQQANSLIRFEFREFVLCDRYAPLIFVNGSDFKAARMFTLAGSAMTSSSSPFSSQVTVESSGDTEGWKQNGLTRSLRHRLFMNELVFEVIEEADGGYCAECLTESIVIEGNSWDGLRANVREAVRGYYSSQPEKLAVRIRLRLARDEVLAT